MENYVYEIADKNILNPNFSSNWLKINTHKNQKAKSVLIKGKPLSISNREFQCVKLLAHGKRIKEIARFLKISHRTVECYLELLKGKTDCDYHEKLVDFYWTYLEPKIIDI